MCRRVVIFMRWSWRWRGLGATMCMTACIIVALGRVVGAGGLCVFSVLSGVFVVVVYMWEGFSV